LASRTIEGRIALLCCIGLLELLDDNHMMAADNQKRALVTGAAGFIGSHIVDELLMRG
jgi:hypothetical protein